MGTRWLQLSLALVTALAVVATGPLPAAGQPPKDKVRIGFSLPLTGIYSAGAESQMNPYQLWAEQVNKKGGLLVKDLGKRLPVELVYYDDKSTPDTAVRVYEKLITGDKVDLVLAPWGTTIHFAIVPVIEKYKVPLIGNTASSVKLRELKTRYFWFITSSIPDRQTKVLVDMMKASGQIKSVAITYVQDLFARENLEYLRSYLTEAGLNVVMAKDYPIGVKDMIPVLTEIKRLNPDAYLSLSYPADSFLITAQAKEVGVNPKLMVELVGPAIVGFYEKFGPVTEGLVTMGHWSPKAPWPGAKQFYDDYVAKFKKRPDYLDSVLAFASGQILEQAVEKAGTLNWEKLRETIATGEFQTIYGPVKFTGPENLVTPAMWLQWQKGELEIVWPPASATSRLLIPKPAW